MIIIPMAGASRRFSEAGYPVAKFMLPLGRETVFQRAVRSFDRYFETERFRFVTGPDPQHAAFVAAECQRLGLKDADIVSLAAPTRGQAETVESGIEDLGNEDPLTIFNIDTFRPNFAYPGGWYERTAGWLEVFVGGGANWSYVRPAAGELALASEVREKVPISDLCCTGLYHFARAGDFRRALQRERAAPQAGEFFVAPLYNHLIAEGAQIGYRLIDCGEVVFCGVPEEYEALKALG